jgi:hypothetical protein
LPRTTRQLSAVIVPTTLSAQTHLSYKRFNEIIAPSNPPVKRFCLLAKNENYFLLFMILNDYGCDGQFIKEMNRFVFLRRTFVHDAENMRYNLAIFLFDECIDNAASP